MVPLADYFLERPGRQGLLLGYAAVPEDDIDRQARRLGEALRRAKGSTSSPD